VVHRQLVILDVPLMIGISVLVLVLGLDGRIGRGDGVLLFVGLIGYVSFLLIKSRRSGGEIPEELKDAIGEEGAKPAPVWKDLLLIVLGLAALVGGSNLFVSGAVTIATLLGWSELVIGLTVIAIGTSLPEIATSVMAVIRGQRGAGGQCRGQQHLQSAVGAGYRLDRRAERHQCAAGRDQFRSAGNDRRGRGLSAHLLFGASHRPLGGRIVLRLLRDLYRLPDPALDPARIAGRVQHHLGLDRSAADRRHLAGDRP